MPLDKQQLIALAGRYYPHSFDPADPNFENSPERKAFYDAWDRAPTFEAWFGVVGAIKNELPGIEVHDATPGRGCGAFRCIAHIKSQSLAGGAALATSLAAYRSVLAPVYGVIWAQRVLVPGPVEKSCPWRAASIEIPEELTPLSEAMARTIERLSGFQRLSPELSRVRVPNILVEFMPLGEATLFDALLDHDPANVY